MDKNGCSKGLMVCLVDDRTAFVPENDLAVIQLLMDVAPDFHHVQSADATSRGASRRKGA
jgi:hypothetical protein